MLVNIFVLLEEMFFYFIYIYIYLFSLSTLFRSYNQCHSYFQYIFRLIRTLVTRFFSFVQMIDCISRNTYYYFIKLNFYMKVAYILIFSFVIYFLWHDNFECSMT